MACGWRSIQGAVNAYLGRHYAPGDRLRVFVTRPGDTRGTDRSEVGHAFVSAQRRAVMVNLDVHLPAGEEMWVLLPPRRG